MPGGMSRSSEASASPIRSWPEDERPRERLKRLGEHRLSDSELLAILLRTGRRGVTAVDLGRALLERFRGFRNMAHLDPSDWASIPGVGEAKAAAIRAAIEIARRLPEEATSRGAAVRTAQDVAARWGLRLRDLKKEVFRILLLDNGRRVLEDLEIAEGTVGEVPVYPREVFHRALQGHAAAIVAFHNHPSGDPAPSAPDRTLTAQLVFAGCVLGIPLVDHVIIGDGRVFSFREAGAIEEARRAFERSRAACP